MSTVYEYSLTNDTLNGSVDLEILNLELTIAGILVDQITLKAGIIAVTTSSDKVLIDPIISNHQDQAAKVYIKELVNSAIIFFQDLMIDYAADNIASGITQYNKTKEVADYLSEVMRYGQSGSLYEVINTIDNLKTAGVPISLSPFVTDATLDAFKLKITNYLGQ